MAAFADAGFPSDEDDAMDPISRTKAMNGAVDDLNSLMDSVSRCWARRSTCSRSSG